MWSASRAAEAALCACGQSGRMTLRETTAPHRPKLPPQPLPLVSLQMPARLCACSIVELASPRGNALQELQQAMCAPVLWLQQHWQIRCLGDDAPGGTSGVWLLDRALGTALCRCRCQCLQALAVSMLLCTARIEKALALCRPASRAHAGIDQVASQAHLCPTGGIVPLIRMGWGSWAIDCIAMPHSLHCVTG